MSDDRGTHYVFGLCFFRIFFVSFLILCCGLPAYGAPDEGMDTPDAPVSTERGAGETGGHPAVKLDKDYLRGYGADFGNIMTSPARWDGAEWVTAALVAGTSLGLYENDAKIRDWVQDNRTSTIDNIGDNVTYLGSGYLTLAVVGGLYVYGNAADDGKAAETALLSVESFALTGVFVQVVKRTAGRRRPYTGDPYNTWTGPNLSSANDSFPSGHASSAFAVAAVIAAEYDNAVVPPLAYAVAAVTGYNRMIHNAHWASDVFVGSAIGYYTGKAIVASHRGGEKSRMSFVPLFDENWSGIALAYEF